MKQEPGYHGCYSGLEDPGIESQQECWVFLFSKTSRPALEPTQTHTKEVWGSFLEVKQQGREASYSVPSSAEKERVELHY
jgi:hypothetical protein